MLSDYEGRNAEPPFTRFQIRSNKEIGEICLILVQDKHQGNGNDLIKATRYNKIKFSRQAQRKSQ